jgi:hypothetical protein
MSGCLEISRGKSGASDSTQAKHTCDAPDYREDRRNDEAADEVHDATRDGAHGRARGWMDAHICPLNTNAKTPSAVNTTDRSRRRGRG